jgi:proteasome accessory factor C
LALKLASMGQSKSHLMTNDQSTNDLMTNDQLTNTQTMSDQNRLQKLLEILTLLSGNMMYSIKEIAQKKELPIRSVYRYIETIENAGFVFHKEGKRMNIDKKNSHGKTLDELLHFSKEEAYILSKAIHSIDDDNLMKANLIKKLYSLYDFKRVANTILKKEQSENVHRLIDAIDQKKLLVLKAYQSGNSATIRDRLVEPIRFTVNYISIWCYELETGMTKTFKTARIKAVEITDTPCNNQQNYKVGHLDSFRISGKYQLPVKLRLSLRAKNLLAEEYPLSEEFIIPESQTSYLFDGWVCAWEGVARFAMGLAGDVEIVDTPELSAFIKEKIKLLKF